MEDLVSSGQMQFFAGSSNDWSRAWKSFNQMTNTIFEPTLNLPWTMARTPLFRTFHNFSVSVHQYAIKFPFLNKGPFRNKATRFVESKHQVVPSSIRRVIPDKAYSPPISFWRYKLNQERAGLKYHLHEGSWTHPNRRSGFSCGKRTIGNYNPDFRNQSFSLGVLS